jgi:MotA/TolQ/ExbB proton channel family
MTSLVRVIGGGAGDGAYDAVFKWVLYAALMGLSAVILWDYGLLQYLFSADTSRISVLIAALFAAFAVHSLWIVLWMAREYRQALAVADTLAQTSGPLTIGDGQITLLQGKVAHEGLIADYLRNLVRTLTTPDRDRGLLLQSMSASLKRRTKVGIYGTDLLYKLGMLGTMIGFVMMLNSMGDMKNFDVETLRAALQRMIGGMAVSLLTTIAGLVGGILLRIFYNLAEGLVTDILQTMVQTTETSLASRLVPGTGPDSNV